MCTQAKVQFGEWPPMLAQVFLDSGSQRNLISSDFARRIGSKPFKFEKVKMAGFDAIPKPRNAGIHKLKLHGFYGQDFELELIELENIVGDISFVSNPYHPSTANELFPAHLITCASPDLLIGINDYLRLHLAPKEILPSGFTRMHSLLGDVIAGEGKLSKRGFNPNSNQVVTPAITVHVSEEDFIVHQRPTLQDRSADEEVINNNQHFTINSRGRLSMTTAPMVTRPRKNVDFLYPRVQQIDIHDTVQHVELKDDPDVSFGTAQRFRALQGRETVQPKSNNMQQGRLKEASTVPSETMRRFWALQSRETVPPSDCNSKHVKNIHTNVVTSFDDWAEQRSREKNNAHPDTTMASKKTTIDGKWYSNLFPSRKKVTRTSGKDKKM
jgi:hypothetical protein